MQKNITGNSLTKLMEDLDLGVNELAWHWGVDRNTIGSYKRYGKKPLPKQKQFQILINDLKANVNAIKADFESLTLEERQLINGTKKK